MAEIIVTDAGEAGPDAQQDAAQAAAVSQGAAAVHEAQAEEHAQAAADAAMVADSAVEATSSAAEVAEESAVVATGAAAEVGALIEAHTVAVREQTAAIQSLVESIGATRTSPTPEPPAEGKTTGKRADREPRQQRGGRVRSWYYGR